MVAVCFFFKFYDRFVAVEFIGSCKDVKSVNEAPILHLPNVRVLSP
jgi:hypothetical protein